MCQVNPGSVAVGP